MIFVGFWIQRQRTALHFAAMAGHRDVIILLVQYGANVHAKGKVRTNNGSLLLLLPMGGFGFLLLLLFFLLLLSEAHRVKFFPLLSRQAVRLTEVVMQDGKSPLDLASPELRPLLQSSAGGGSGAQQSDTASSQQQQQRSSSANNGNTTQQSTSPSASRGRSPTPAVGPITGRRASVSQEVIAGVGITIRRRNARSGPATVVYIAADSSAARALAWAQACGDESKAVKEGDEVVQIEGQDVR